VSAGGRRNGGRGPQGLSLLTRSPSRPAGSGRDKDCPLPIINYRFIYYPWLVDFQANPVARPTTVAVTAGFLTYRLEDVPQKQKTRLSKGRF
jgi:hypothetical protein